MDLKYCASEISNIALSMFRKNFFGVFHGSISARIQHDSFLINKRTTIFDNLKEEDLIMLNSKRDYRWNDASIDADIHLNIYKNINEAKYICYAMPPYLTAYTLGHSFIRPRDYFGYIKHHEIPIYDPKQFDDWYERADTEIYRYMLENKTNIMVIKGYGVYVHSRTPYQLAKDVAILENTCKLLSVARLYESERN
ncbi:putative aldolase [Campylobacter showae]|jgi:L-fuculose-1-phosphate aldolase|uniref:Class II Aldolase and Adducin domain protein n=1 Tax=Campylobacter showae RM3277 TaxID=553219 RepID=C6RGA5_9BACT|nr:class II aldolase and adducin N-terminal domain-containing protein [Campylobacter showae]EET79455.1 class II Aldolase and Adducin domain protein [Campylobacter showae RM3277]QCD49091.1 putative aldolase [Campylobacter showae]